MTPSQASVLILFVGVLNITTWSLPTSSSVLLRKGLNFIPTPFQSQTAAHTTANESIDKMYKNMSWSEHFGGEAPPANINTRLIMPSIYDPPKGTKHLRAFIYDVRAGIHAEIDKPTKIRWNYRQKDLRDLHEFSFTADCEMLPSDKNLGPIYLPRSWRHDESLSVRQLGDQNTYAICTDPMKEDVIHTLVTFITDNEKDFPLSQKEYDGLLTKTQQFILLNKWPMFKLLPKIHKLEKIDNSSIPELRGRPIIAAHSCPSAPLSIFVDAFLSTFAWSAKNVLKDTKSLVSTLDSFDLPANTHIATADITSLYPNIPTDWGCRVVRGYLLQRGVPFKIALLVTEALKIVLTSNIFNYAEHLFKQLQGTAMGTHCAPTYATIVLVTVEQSSKISYADILFFRRFIDDLIIVARNALALTRFLKEYQSVRQEFALTTDFGPSINFMNLTITVVKYARHLEIRPYSKKFNKFLYLPFSSHHPMHMKKAFCKSLISTLVINSSSEEIYLQELSICYDRLRNRGYPLSLLQPILLSVNYADRAQMLAPKKPTPSESVTVLNLPFNSIFCRIPVGRLLHTSYENTLAHGFTTLRTPIVSWSRTHNVGDITNIARARALKQPKRQS